VKLIPSAFENFISNLNWREGAIHNTVSASAAITAPCKHGITPTARYELFHVKHNQTQRNEWRTEIWW